MNEREFIKLVRELHLLQLKVLGEEHLSIEIRLSRIKPAAYVSFFLNIYDSQRNIRELYLKLCIVIPCIMVKQRMKILLLIREF